MTKLDIQRDKNVLKRILFSHNTNENVIHFATVAVLWVKKKQTNEVNILTGAIRKSTAGSFHIIISVRE